MKVKRIESGLAWIGALVVLVGVSFAAGSAFGSESVGNADAAASSGDVAAVTVTGARDANAEAATEAAAAIARETAMGLEIKLADRTLTIVADAQ